MGLLDGGIASIFHSAFSGLYLDATHHAGTGEPVYDANGNITGYLGGDQACKAQVDAATDAMRRAEGYAEGDARIIVLAQGLTGGIDSDHEITVRGQKYRILSAELDPAASHYVCRARAV